MNRFGVGWVAALTWASFMGCGGNTNDAVDGRESEHPGSGGSRSKPAEPNDGSGGDKVGTDGGDAGSGEAGTASGGSSAGCPGDAPLPRDVVEATERCLDRELPVTDPLLLDGASFVLPEGLCPEIPWDESREQLADGDQYSASRATSLRTLHLRRQGDELELVSSMSTSSAPIVQRTPLARTSLGFSAANLSVCNAAFRDFEEEVDTLSYEIPLAHLAFVPGKKAGTFEALFGARLDVDERTIVLTGKPDHEAPALNSAPHAGFAPPYDYFFEEPVKEGKLSLDDGSGNTVTLHPLSSEGFLIGLRVEDYIAGRPAFDLEVTDLAGNAWLPGDTHSGITLGPTDGDLESSDDYVLVDDYSNPCWEGRLLPDDDTPPPVPPLRGAASLLLYDCSAYFRVTRLPGATQVTFEARALNDLPLSLGVEVHVIGKNGPSTSWNYELEAQGPSTDVEWLPDPEYTTASSFFSVPTKIAVQLPETGDDLVVKIEAGPDSSFWLDGFATE